MKDYNVLDDLVSTTQNLHRDIFDKGYDQGYKDGKDEAYKNPVPTQDAYNEGLEDARKYIKRLIELDSSIKFIIFGYTGNYDIIDEFTAQDIIDELKAWEEEREQVDDEIKIGDVVNAPGFHAPVVVIALYDNDSVKVMNSLGDTGVHLKCNIIKTGRHFDQISEVLEQLKII